MDPTSRNGTHLKCLLSMVSDLKTNHSILVSSSLKDIFTMYGGDKHVLDFNSRNLDWLKWRSFKMFTFDASELDNSTSTIHFVLYWITVDCNKEFYCSFWEPSESFNFASFHQQNLRNI